jgi:hypothetical protein
MCSYDDLGTQAYANARPANFQRVAVDDAGLPDEIVGQGYDGRREQYLVQRRANPVVALQVFRLAPFLAQCVFRGPNKPRYWTHPVGQISDLNPVLWNK